MISAYVDASVVVRILLGEPSPLPEWTSLTFGVSSELLRVECYRAVERLWRLQAMNDEKAEAKRAEITRMLANIQLREIQPSILARAAEPFPTFIGSLDAIHLATALAYRRTQPDEPILFATHDKQLAKAAAALHFNVVGVAA